MGASGGQQKLNAHISTDMLLQLPTLEEEGGLPSMVQYHLYAVVNHIGSSPQSGHYICLGRHSEDAASCWHCYDDSMVKALASSLSQAQLDEHVNGSATAYILFYK